MKFRYEITAFIRMVDKMTNEPLLQYEQIRTLYDSPKELNPNDPHDFVLAKRIIKCCYECMLMKEDRLPDLGTCETNRDVMNLTINFVKQVGRGKDHPLNGVKPEVVIHTH